MLERMRADMIYIRRVPRPETAARHAGQGEVLVHNICPTGSGRFIGLNGFRIWWQKPNAEGVAHLCHCGIWPELPPHYSTVCRVPQGWKPIEYTPEEREFAREKGYKI
jgi:hypothetical protein